MTPRAIRSPGHRHRARAGGTGVAPQGRAVEKKFAEVALRFCPIDFREGGGATLLQVVEAPATGLTG